MMLTIHLLVLLNFQGLFRITLASNALKKKSMLRGMWREDQCLLLLLWGKLRALQRRIIKVIDCAFSGRRCAIPIEIVCLWMQIYPTWCICLRQLALNWELEKGLRRLLIICRGCLHERHNLRLISHRMLGQLLLNGKLLHIRWACNELRIISWLLSTTLVSISRRLSSRCHARIIFIKFFLLIGLLNPFQKSRIVLSRLCRRIHLWKLASIFNRLFAHNGDVNYKNILK